MKKEPEQLTDRELESSLRFEESLKAGHYEQRTRHKSPDGTPRYINRLILEDSPYLLQHAHNPVNWYSWGDEAFTTAAEEDKPVFLSIGYSTCHWCHVMEAECFDDEVVAALLNQHFISIKLDREQYPDIDDIYMTGLQIMAGQGGWPMSNFLLPDGKPFYSGTYFPPQQFKALLERIAALWLEKRDELAASATRIVTAINQIVSAGKNLESLDINALEKDVDGLLEREDRTDGGLAGAPKFPQEPLLYFLLDSGVRHNHPGRIGFVLRALDAMARGGIYDQVGGGFHRYSTDAQWLVPHFEKMLYNQSQLGYLYLRAWQLTGNAFLLRILDQTLNYVLREMQLPLGGFYSATDADTQEREGLYFIWTRKELEQLLSASEYQLLEEIYSISEAGNFEAANILAMPQSWSAFVGSDASGQRVNQLDAVLLKLRHAREQRIAPLRDDKLIVAWASTMANTLAWAGHLMPEPAFLKAAINAVEFIWQQNFPDQKNLKRIYLNGKVSIPGQLEDFAALVEVLITLFDITRNITFLNRAALLMDQAIELFLDSSSDSFFLSQSLEQGPVLARSVSASDGAVLSATGVTLFCLSSLAKRKFLLPDKIAADSAGYENKLEKCVASLGSQIAESPASHTTVLRAVNDHRLGSNSPIQYAGDGRVRVELCYSDTLPSRRLQDQFFVNVRLDLMAGLYIKGSAEESNPGSFDVTLDNGDGQWQLEGHEASPIIPLQEEKSPFSGKLECRLELRRVKPASSEGAGIICLLIAMQVCDDKQCLVSETLRFYL